MDSIKTRINASSTPGGAQTPPSDASHVPAAANAGTGRTQSASDVVETPATNSTSSPHPHIRARFLSHLGGFLKWLVTSIAIILVLDAFQALTAERYLTAGGSYLLQNLLDAKSKPADRLAVLGVDKIQPEKVARLGGLVTSEVTPRLFLKNVLNFTVQADPIAILVDINCSPDQWGLLSDQDAQFFEYCMDLRKRSSVPIYLGLSGASYEAFLTRVDHKYWPLFVCINCPNEPDQLIRHMEIIGVSREQIEERLPAGLSIQDALPKPAAVALSEVPERGFWNDLLFGSTTEVQNVLRLRKDLIDWSWLDAVRASKYVVSTPERIEDLRDRIEGRYILIGDVNNAEDRIIVPRVGEIPGIYAHACATLTLAEGEIRHPKPALNLFLDLLVSGIVTLLGSLRVPTETNKEDHEISPLRVLFILSIFAIVLVLLWHILWIDVFVVIGAVSLHHWLDRNKADDQESAPATSGGQNN